MAYPVWRRGSKRVYVYYYDRNTGELKQVRREETKHLDGKPPEVVHKWVEDWEAAHGVAKDRSERIHLKDGDKLLALWRQYQSHRMMTRKRRERTAEEETEIFERYVVPFFVEERQKKDPAFWHDLVPEFHTHLFEKKLKDATIRKTLWLLERFGKHLVFQRHMTFPYVVQVPARQNNKVTPLKVSKTPKQILEYVKELPAPTPNTIDFRLAVLIGYFGGLGPGELFPLSKSDLITGDAAEKAAKTLEGFRKHKLGSRLSIAVNKTLTDEEGAQPQELMKNDYRRGVVNIWNVEAAKLIAAIVKERPDGRLFPFSYGWLERAWRETVKPVLGVTPHDLRRASCLYLGRTLRLEPTLVQEHMRHAELETTLLYMREPSVPEKRRFAVQDFDDVA